MTFIPSKLGIPRSTGTYPVKWENPGWGLTGVYDYWLWGDDYSEEGPLDVTISNASTSGCTINFTNPSTITTDSSTIFRLYPKGLTTAQLEDTMPVYLHSQAPGFYPANSSITVPNTGGTYTVEYILSKADIIKWTCDVVNATALVSVEVLEWDSCSIKFKFTVRANTQWNTDLIGTIQLGAYYDTNKFISYSYGFKIEKSNTPEDLKLVVTPSSGTYGASAFVTEEFHLSTTKAEETITSFNVTCPQASNIKKDIVDNYFVLTVPENKTTNNLEFSAMVTATTSGGYTLEATVPIKQAATSLVIPNTNYEVSWTASTLNIIGTGSNNLDDVVFSIPVGWISGQKFSVNPQGVATISLNIAENSGLSSRQATIGVSVIKNSSSIINLSINITQSVKSDISPIWKDYVWEEIISSDFIEYHLDYAGEMVYAGKAYKYPETDRVEFLLNNVAENYLSNGIIFNTSKTIISPEYLKPFTLMTSSGNEKPITFFNDWSYKDRDLTKGTMLSDPITGLVDPRQYLVSSWILPTGTGVINRFFYMDGVQSAMDISLNSGINGYTYTEDLSNKLWPCGSYLIVGFVEGGNISDRQIRYDIDTTGKDYVLYYTNSAGGWDSLLVEGNVKKNDEIKSETYTRKVLNTSQEFARNKYLNTITSSWVLYTGYLNDIQASKMFNLIESTKVYLHNLKDNTITPVLITDTNCEYKTYTNQGKNKFYYTINVEASQDTYRK